MAIQRADTLDIPQDLVFTRRQLRIQRAGWIAMALILVAAFAGVFGDGPLADAHAGTAGGPVRVNYHRIDRKHRPTAFAVDFAPDATADGGVRLFVNDDLLAGIDLADIIPQPSAMRAAPGGTIFVIAIDQPGQAVTIRMAYEYNHPGLIRAEIGLAGSPPLRFSVLVLP